MSTATTQATQQALKAHHVAMNALSDFVKALSKERELLMRNAEGEFRAVLRATLAASEVQGEAVDYEKAGTWLQGHAQGIKDGMKLEAAKQEKSEQRECDSPDLCRANRACAGQYGTKKQCSTFPPAQPAKADLQSRELIGLTDEEIVDEMPADLFNQNYVQLQIKFGLNIIAKLCEKNAFKVVKAAAGRQLDGRTWDEVPA